MPYEQDTQVDALSGVAERLKAYLGEVESDVQTLEVERATLAVERDERIVQLREEYGAKISAIDDTLRMIERLRGALDPEAAKAAREAKAEAVREAKAAKKTSSSSWTPKPEKLLESLRGANVSGRTESEMLEATDGSVSKATHNRCIVVLRERGMLRLKGRKGMARVYSITEAGKQHLEQADGPDAGRLSLGQLVQGPGPVVTEALEQEQLRA